MARIRITDHERFNGEYRAVTQGNMRLGTQMELQDQTGWTNKEMAAHLEQGPALTAALIFATLWQNGMRPTWAEVIDLENSQLRFVREASDPAEDGDEPAEDGEADPTQAPKASPRGDEPAPAAEPSQP